MAYTIYDEDIWKRIIEKHNLKNLAIELGVYENPEKARQMMKEFYHNFGLDVLTERESHFCTLLSMVKFVEQNYLDMLVSTGSQHASTGEIEYVVATENLILDNFNSSFRDFLIECEKRDIDLESIKFSEAYEIFLQVIKLKMKYKDLYTKLFVRKLLEIFQDCFKKDDALEIKQFFLKEDPKMLLELIEELKI